MNATRVRHGSSALLLVSLLAFSACAKRPPDADATPTGANALALDTPRADVLDCREDDCTDWFRTVVPAKGELVVELRSAADGENEVRIAVALVDAQGGTLARDQTVGRTAISVSSDVSAATYLVAVASNHPEARFDYTLTARLIEPPPPPPPPPVAKPVTKRRPPPVAKPPAPRFETRRAEVLELDESGPHGRAVLLDAGSSHGLRVGLHGRLFDGGRPIATLEIVEVYPEGCLARVHGGPATIGVTSTAEIEIPLAP